MRQVPQDVSRPMEAEAHREIPRSLVVYADSIGRFEPAVGSFEYALDPTRLHEVPDPTKRELLETTVTIHEPTHLFDTCNTTFGQYVFLNGPWGWNHIIDLLNCLLELRRGRRLKIPELRTQPLIRSCLRDQRTAEAKSALLHGYAFGSGDAPPQPDELASAVLTLQSGQQGLLGAMVILESSALMRQLASCSPGASEEMARRIGMSQRGDPLRAWPYSAALEVLARLRKVCREESEVYLVMDLCLWGPGSNREFRANDSHPGCRLGRILELLETPGARRRKTSVVRYVCRKLGWDTPSQIAEAKLRQLTASLHKQEDLANRYVSHAVFRLFGEDCSRLLACRLETDDEYISQQETWSEALGHVIPGKLCVHSEGNMTQLAAYTTTSARGRIGLREGVTKYTSDRSSPPAATDQWLAYWMMRSVLSQILSRDSVSCSLSQSPSCADHNETTRCELTHILQAEKPCLLGRVAVHLGLDDLIALPAGPRSQVKRS